MFLLQIPSLFHFYFRLGTKIQKINYLHNYVDATDCPFFRTTFIMKAEKSDSIFFGGLNGLRFFAATAVIFHHIEQYKLWASNDGHFYTSAFTGCGLLSTFIQALGHKAVSFFFVLSGFLITYLLLAETAKTGTVNLRKFYVRRILRIWPVYYLVIGIAFFVIPHFFDVGGNGAHLLQNKFWLWFGLSLIMLPNLTRYNSVEIVGGSQTWSVGVEEQFYLIWPWLVRTFRKRFVRMLLILIVGKLFISVTMAAVTDHLPAGTLHTVCNKFVLYWNLFKIEQMAVGALGAFYLYHKKPVVLQFFYHPITTVATLVLFVSLFVTDLEYAGSTLFEGLIFLLFIVNVSTNNKFPIQLRQSVFTTLGNISYGIYMYHTIIIAILINLLQKTMIDDMPLAFDIALYTLSVTLTILISYLSYKYFETPFLKFKEKFMVVKSSGTGPKTAEVIIPVEEDAVGEKKVVGM